MVKPTAQKWKVPQNGNNQGITSHKKGQIFFDFNHSKFTCGKEAVIRISFDIRQHYNNNVSSYWYHINFS